MKWFFYGLLAANAAFLAWIHWHPVASVAPAPAMVDHEGGSRLTLLSELPKLPPLRAKEAPTAPPASSPAASAVKLQCLRISGFDSEAKAMGAGHKLQRAGAQLRHHGSDSGETTRYWIMLPPYRSAAAARPALERLRRHKMTDYYLVHGGDNKNAISLGVYSTHAAARRRAQEIRNIGLRPRIQEIKILVRRWWLDFDWPAKEGERWRSALGKSDSQLPVQACR